jgi:hypothetical protein
VALQFKLGLGRPPFEVSRSHTITHIDTQTRSMTSLNEWSARGIGRHLHNKHNRRTSVPSSGFVFMILEIVRPQTYGSDCMATGIGIWKIYPRDLGLEVTDKVMKDRKILSHAVREKLSRPTQYSILYNTKKKVMWPGHVQRMSHNNWPEKVLQ